MPAGSQNNASSAGMPNRGKGINGQWPVAPVTIDSEIHHSEARNQPKPAAPPIKPASIIESARATINAGRDNTAISGTRPKGGRENDATMPASMTRPNWRQSKRASVTGAVLLTRDAADLQQCQASRIALDNLEL
jgi:hypothetical protein